MRQDRLVGTGSVGRRMAVQAETSDWAREKHGTSETCRDKAEGRVGYRSRLLP